MQSGDIVQPWYYFPHIADCLAPGQAEQQGKQYLGSAGAGGKLNPGV